MTVDTHLIPASVGTYSVRAPCRRERPVYRGRVSLLDGARSHAVGSGGGQSTCAPCSSGIPVCEFVS